MTNDRSLQVILIAMAVLIAVALGWLGYVQRLATRSNHRAIIAACVAFNQGQKVQRHVLVTLRDRVSITLTPAQLARHDHTFDELLATVRTEKCPT